jgi:hypothetical protein
MLELAYWIGPTPGVENHDAQLDRYRDATQPPDRAPVRDRYVIFHLHLDRASEMLRTIGGRTYMGIPHITLFHGQETELEPDGGWRVDNRDAAGVNARAGFDCPYHGDGTGTIWYIGSPQNLENQGFSESDLRFWRQLDLWATNLFSGGYTGVAGQSLIFQGGVRLPNGDIDARNPGTEIRQYGRSFVAGNRDPHSLSWTLHRAGPPNDNRWNHDSWDYDFAPQRPPPSS